VKAGGRLGSPDGARVFVRCQAATDAVQQRSRQAFSI